MGSGAIFNGLNIKLLKDRLLFKSGLLIITNDSDDPTSVAKSAPQGSLYFRVGTDEIYKKEDNGSSTNWTQILDVADLATYVEGPASATDNAIARYDLTTGKLIQDSGVTIDDTDLVSTPNDVVVFEGTTQEFNVGQELFELTSTGLNTGGAISIGVPNTTYDVSAGSGQIVDQDTNTLTRVTWGAITGTTPGGNGVRYIYINSGGTITETTTVPDAVSRRNNILLGRIVVSGGVVTAVVASPVILREASQQVYDMAKAISLFQVSGAVFTPNGANLSLDRSAGVLFDIGANFQVDPKDPHEVSIASASPVTFQHITQTASTGTDVTVISPGNYDNGGTITAIPGSPNQATNMRVYQFPSGNVRIAYGQVIHPTLAEAVQQIPYETFVVNPSIPGNGLLRAVISVQAGATSLNNSSQAKFIAVTRFGDAGAGASASGTTTLQQAYTNSPNGEIILDSTRNGIAILDAASTVTTLFTVEDNTGTTQYLDVRSDSVTSQVPVIFSDQLDVDNINLNGNTISIIDLNGNLNLEANGTGNVIVSTGYDLIAQDNVTVQDNLTVQGKPILDESTSAATGTAQTIAAPTTGVLTLTDADLESIEGLSGATANQMLLLVNQTGRTITLLNESGTAANQIVTGEGQDSLMADGSSVWLYYGDNTKWNKVGNNNVNIPLVNSLGTETWTNTSGSTCTVTLQRMGQYLYVEGYVDMAGAFADTELNVDIPAKYAIDTAWYQNVSTTRPIIGRASLSDAGAPSFGSVLLVASTVMRIQVEATGSTYNVGANLTSTIPFTWNSSDFITFNAMFKVAAWSQNTISGLASQSTPAYGLAGQTTNQTINTTPAVIQYNNTSFNYKVVGSGITWNNSSNRWEFTKTMRVKIFACVTIQATVTNLEINIRKNGVNQAIQLGDSSDTSSVGITYTLDVVSGDNIDITAVTASGSTTTSNNASRSYVIIEEVPFSTTSIATALVPTIQKFTSGSGTYTTPTGVKYLTVEMVGGGGGGASGGASSTTGTTGNSTTFGPMEAFGGIGGGFDNTRGIGGAASLGSGPIGIAVQGNAGSPGATNIGTASFTPSGGTGGAGPWGGAGIGGYSGATGTAGAANSGAGGGGGSGNAATGPAAGGGGAGGYIKAQINNPAASYSYSVGSGGAGAAGSVAGQAGGSGVIIVTEHY